MVLSTVAAPVCIPTNSTWVSLSTSLPTLVSYVFDTFDRYEVTSHCGFDLQFPDDQWCWTSFHLCVGHQFVFFGEKSVHVFCTFFNWFICILGVEFCKFFIYFGTIYNYIFLNTIYIIYKFIYIFLSDVICKYLLPFNRFPLSFVDCFLHCAVPKFILMSSQ